MSTDVDTAEQPDGRTEKRALSVIRDQLAEATSKRKCHTCGCLHATVEALATTSIAPEIQAELDAARAVFAPKKYDCLGCEVCYPAIAANAFADEHPEQSAGLDLCPTEAPAPRDGWPPLAGDYRVLRYRASVAVCVLNSAALMDALVRRPPEGLSIVGTMHTENLGIERVIVNVLANPNIRFLLVCGEDTRQRVGHLPGRSLASLCRSGIDASGRIQDAPGRRPILENVSASDVAAFRDRIVLVNLIGETNVGPIIDAIADCDRRNPGPHAPLAYEATIHPIEVPSATRLIRDPAGFFVVYPDRARDRLSVEHYTNAGVLDAVLTGRSPADLCAEIIARGLISRLDHAAYLGRELSRAEAALASGERFVQDRATGEELPRTSCGCGTERGPAT